MSQTGKLIRVAHLVTLGKLHSENTDLSTPEAREAAYYAMFDTFRFPADVTDEQYERVADTFWSAIHIATNRKENP